MPQRGRRGWRILAIVALIACARPVPADLDTEIEEGLGNWIAQAFIAQRGRLDQPPVSDWVSRVGRDLLEHAPPSDFDYHFVVLDSPEANGFALPGGWIFVTAGLLESMQSEDELAAVIAHELGHIANNDFQRVMLRTALWLGLAEVLRNNDHRDWVPLVQGAQLVETLSHSRKREVQADRFGAKLSWDAGYDPRAMAAFLGEKPKWSYLQTIFSTHPHPTRRSDWLRERFTQLRTEDPQGALALARSLIDRGRHARAEGVLAEPLPGEHEERRKALLEQIEGLVPRDEPGGGVSVDPERLAAMVRAVSSAGDARSVAAPTRRVAWKRLRRLWDDRQVERGLIVAQAVDPELNDPGYLLLVAQTVNVLHQAMRGANLIARTLGMRREAAEGLTELGRALAGTRVEPARAADLTAQADAVTRRAEALAAGAQPQTEALARLVNRYHHGALMVAPLLVELALSGEGDPAKRLTFARFMLIEAKVGLLAEQLNEYDAQLEDDAAEAWEAAIDTYRLRLNVAALGTDERMREAIVKTLARRIGAEPEALRKARGEGALPGDGALALLREMTQPRDDRFGRDLRATQILIRIGFIEVKEQVAWFAKEKGATEGAGTLAIRGAVRHPQ